jgi:hypothetical protein
MHVPRRAAAVGRRARSDGAARPTGCSCAPDPPPSQRPRPPAAGGGPPEAFSSIRRPDRWPLRPARTARRRRVRGDARPARSGRRWPAADCRSPEPPGRPVARHPGSMPDRPGGLGDQQPTGARHDRRPRCVCDQTRVEPTTLAHGAADLARTRASTTHIIAAQAHLPAVEQASPADPRECPGPGCIPAAGDRRPPNVDLWCFTCRRSRCRCGCVWWWSSGTVGCR